MVIGDGGFETGLEGSAIGDGRLNVEKSQEIHACLDVGSDETEVLELNH